MYIVHCNNLHLVHVLPWKTSKHIQKNSTSANYGLQNSFITMHWTLCTFYKKVVGLWVREGGSPDRNKSYFVHVSTYLLSRLVETDVGPPHEAPLPLVKISVAECLLFSAMLGQALHHFYWTYVSISKMYL